VKAKSVPFAVAALVVASGCGRSQGTLGQGGDGGDVGISGSTGVELGGTGGAGAAGGSGLAGNVNLPMSGAAGATSEGPRSGAGGLGQGGNAPGAGTGGFAGAIVALTDAEVCADACAQTIHPLPNALCEDWPYPDDEHVAEYCLAGESRDCALRCEEQLGAVSSDCNVALHRAIPCVARTDLYQGGPIAIECLFAECTGLLIRVTAACTGLRQELAAARQRWETAGSDSYSYELSMGASVYEIVVRDGVASLVEGIPAEVPTIPELFDQIEGSLEVAPPSVTYDPALGYPTEVHARAPNCQSPNVGFFFAVTELVLE
jgi:hypothetical protein